MFKYLCTSIFILFIYSDTYGIFIDSGSPDSYFSSDVSNFINDTIFNITINFNSTAIVNGTTHGYDEDVTDLIIMIITSIVLGLTILITIIGMLYNFKL